MKRFSFKYHTAKNMEFDCLTGTYKNTYSRNGFLTVTTDTKKECEELLDSFRNYIYSKTDYWNWDGDEDPELNEKTGKWEGSAAIYLEEKNEFEYYKEFYKEWKAEIKNTPAKEEIKEEVKNEKEEIEDNNLNFDTSKRTTAFDVLSDLVAEKSNKRWSLTRFDIKDNYGIAMLDCKISLNFYLTKKFEILVTGGDAILSNCWVDLSKDDETLQEAEKSLSEVFEKIKAEDPVLIYENIYRIYPNEIKEMLKKNLGSNKFYGLQTNLKWIGLKEGHEKNKEFDSFKECLQWLNKK